MSAELDYESFGGTGYTVRKRRAQFDNGSSDKPKSKRPYLGYVTSKVLGCEEMQKEVREEVRQKEVPQKKVQEEVQQKEVWKREAHFDDEVCDLPKPKRVLSSFVGRIEV